MSCRPSTTTATGTRSSSAPGEGAAARGRRSSRSGTAAISRCSPACRTASSCSPARGNGKTTMARGLAQVAALALAAKRHDAGRINPHAFQRHARREPAQRDAALLTDTIPEIAARRPFTWCYRRGESFAVRRSTASFEANPVACTAPPTRCSSGSKRSRASFLGALRHHTNSWRPSTRPSCRAPTS